MKLETLLKDLDCTLEAGSLETEISALEYDSRKVGPGSLFVCLTGFRADGHAYIPQALAAGAAALVVERETAAPAGVAVVRVADSRAALALLSAAWFGHPAEKLTVIGITGTKGKTTTAHMLRAILEAAGRRVGMIGTNGAFIAGEHIETRNTTPESYELHAFFRRMADAGCDCVVMEASSQGFKLRRTAGIQFDIGVFLNLSPDHIGGGEHENFEEYLQCKRTLFRQCKRGLVNTGDEHWREITAGATCPLTTFALEGEADYRLESAAEERRPGFLGSRFTVSGRLSGEFLLSMPGRFNVENALAALAAADMAGAGREAVAAGLSSVQVKGRTQLLPTPGHYTMLIDYAHNAVSMENLLPMLRAYHPHRLICLLGSGGNRSPVRRYGVGR